MLILNPANVRIRREPKHEVEVAADAAARLLWARIDASFDDDLDFWLTRIAGFRSLFRAARAAKLSGGDLEAEGVAVYEALRSPADVDPLDDHTFRSLGAGLRLIKRSFVSGSIPLWMSEASGLKPI